ncbi:MAG TPA: HAMP domain-containing sensor histidine kinase [Gaiellaceae bacterium]|nr:HAMP domain-containing sensor histidine kinase [Gaiellaceae bacterium]
MTASTADLAARFGWTRPYLPVNGEAPEHAVPFTALAVATAYALLFLPTGGLSYTEASVAAVIGAMLLGLAIAWPAVPRVAAIAVPIGYIALAAVLRDAAGGSQSGFGGLFLLPVLWLAVTAGRRELFTILVAMTVAQLVPLALIGYPDYPASGWRGALVLTTVAGITGLMVQRLVGETRRRAAQLEQQTDSLTRISAQLADQNERLLELDRLKDEFVATASHELRTPLTSISGYLEMSLDPSEGPLSPTRENHLRIVQRNADRLTVLVDQLLFLARADSHPLELDRQPVDLGGILEEAVETARPAARAKEIALLVELSASQQVIADRAQLLRIVENLVVNAVKFTPDGGMVRLGTRGEGPNAILEVTDTGVGIPAAEQHDLFNRFFRGTSAIQKAVPGSGLGLAISQMIAAAHGTAIEVESAPGAGSTFRLALPAAAA